MLKNFASLFRSKTEKSMQSRAEDSRKLDKLEEEFHEQASKTHQNLESFLSEITSKKKNG